MFKKSSCLVLGILLLFCIFPNIPLVSCAVPIAVTAISEDNVGFDVAIAIAIVISLMIIIITISKRH